MSWGVKNFLKKLSMSKEDPKERVKFCIPGADGPKTVESGDRCFLSTEEMDHEMNKWKCDGVLPWAEWGMYK